MTNRAATSVLFGFDFQANAAIVLMLENIKDMSSIRLEGSEDIEINLTYIIHSGFISGYQNRYGDNLKPPTNVYHRMTA